MTEKDLLTKIGITDAGAFDANNCFVIDIPDYNTFGKYYSRLEKASEVEELTSTSMINIHATDVTYQTTEEFSLDNNGDSFIIKILGDLDNEDYKLIVQKIN